MVRRRAATVVRRAAALPLVLALLALVSAGPASAASPKPPPPSPSASATLKPKPPPSPSIAPAPKPALSATTTTSTPIGPVDPSVTGKVPGGVTFTPASSNMITTGGEDWTFTGFDFTQVSALWWGPAQALATAGGRSYVAGLAADGAIDVAGETMTFDSSQPDLAAGKEYWSGSFTFSATSYPSRLVVTVTDPTGATPVPLVLASSVAGMPASAGAVAPITGNFKANLTMQMQASPGTWSDPKTWYDGLGAGHGAGGTLMSSFDGGMWYVGTSFASVGTSQYHLADNDGSTWAEIDPALRLTVKPGFAQSALLGGNSDLWTANAGYNQDIGIFMSDNGGADQLISWKESGGFAGTFSPNAAFVQGYVGTLTAGHTYVFTLKWKTNKPASGATIYAGAGPINTAFSPTRLTAKLVPAGVAYLWDVAHSNQYHLADSDGSTWAEIDPSLRLSLTTGGDGRFILVGANVDLWTANAGYNQDVAIFMSVDGSADQLVAWKESGGFAGTFSPNAAYVQGAVGPTTAPHAYIFKLKWKANKNATGATIFAGAGPISTLFSPTRLTALSLPAPTSPNLAVFQTQQYHLAGNDGATWVEIDPTNLRLTYAPAANTSALLGANIDLWTANAGYNQDVGLFMSDNGGADQLVGWKESGGFAGTFSPNAAYLQSIVDLTGGHTYVFKLKWKANKNAAGATIYAAAGPISSAFSPTRVTLQTTT